MLFGIKHFTDWGKVEIAITNLFCTLWSEHYKIKMLFDVLLSAPSLTQCHAVTALSEACRNLLLSYYHYYYYYYYYYHYYYYFSGIKHPCNHCDYQATVSENMHVHMKKKHIEIYQKERQQNKRCVKDIKDVYRWSKRKP